MNQLPGRYVNVVLIIEEGRGMGYIKNPIFVSANFNGRILESDIVDVSDKPVFNTELLWEIEKKDLRKLRSTNQPLRLECYSVKSTEQKERIGFALLSLRAAQIIPNSNNATLIWQKFIGVHDKKYCHPEVYISLSIQEHVERKLIQNNDESVSVSPFISEEDTETTNTNDSNDEEDDENQHISVKYLDDGFIRIGNDGNDQFSLNLLVQASANLHSLLPEVMVFGKSNQKFFISFKIFGIIIKTKPFDKPIDDAIEMNEKIVVRLLSNKTTLLEFLKIQNVLICFCCGNDKLGITEVDLSKLIISDEDDDEIMECQEFCFFKLPSKHGIVPGSPGMQPYIEIQSSLIMDKSSSKPSGDDDTVKSKDVYKKVSPVRKGAGDREMQELSPRKKDKSPRKLIIPKPVIMDEIDDYPKKEKNVDPSMLRPLCQPKPLKPCQNITPYKRYALEVALKNFCVLKESYKDYDYKFKILHPKAVSCLLNVNPKDEALSKFRLYYICTEDNIENVLKLWPPKISITDRKENPLSQENTINTALFIQKKSKNKFFEDDYMLLYAYQEILKCNEGKDCVSFEVVMSLTESYLEIEDDKTNLDLLPPVIDEEITIEELTKLESWKNREMETFKEKMYEIEKKERSKLSTELEESRNKAELIIKEQIEKCQELQKELRNKVNSIRTENMMRNKRKSLTTTVVNNIKQKLGQKYAKVDPDLLLIIINKLELDNQALKDVITEQNDQLKAHQHSTLTKEQTANLLQELKGLEEKFEEAQTAKTYFKSQWKQAFEEVHELKKKDYKNLQAELKQSRDELSHLSLESFTETSEECNLIYDGFRTSRIGKENCGDI